MPFSSISSRREAASPLPISLVSDSVVLSTARALPAIADAVKGELKILADSGIRNGLDVVRMIALGADSVLLGRAFVYALAAQGEAGVANLLDLMAKEMRVAMTLTGATTIADISRQSLAEVTRHMQVSR